MRHLLLPFWLALALAIALPGSALAHADLLRSDPTPDAVLEESPREVRLGFSEPLEAGFSRARVLDNQGQTVDLGDSHLELRDRKVLVVSLPSLTPGYYTVAWRVLSQVDGHVTEGSFSFAVGPVSGPPGVGGAGVRRASFPPAEPALRWLTLVGAAAIAGGFIFRRLAPRLPPSLEGTVSGEQVLQRWRHNTLRVLAGGVAVAAVGTLGALLQQAAALAEGLPTLAALGQVLSTRWGLLWLARMELLAALGLLLSVLAWRKWNWPWWAGSGMGLMLLLTLSLNSHAAATGDTFTLTMEALHLVAAALWLGGLFQFGAALFPALRGAPAKVRDYLLRAFLPRFSALAIACVLVLLLTGVYAWWVEVGVLRPALGTAYGKALLAKLLLVLPLLVLGAVNLLWVRHSIERPQVWARFVTFVRAEAVLALSVLMAVGFLTTVPPARQELAARPSPIHFGGSYQGVLYHGQISPGQVGWNTYQIWLWDEGGQPFSGIQEVSLRFNFQGAQLGRSEVLLEPSGPGQFRAQGSHLSLRGPWRAEVSLKREDAYDLRLPLRFQVPNTLISPTPPHLPLPWRTRGP